MKKDIHEYSILSAQAGLKCEWPQTPATVIITVTNAAVENFKNNKPEGPERVWSGKTTVWQSNLFVLAEYGWCKPNDKVQNAH